jgi:hypothetical protein
MREKMAGELTALQGEGRWSALEGNAAAADAVEENLE